MFICFWGKSLWPFYIYIPSKTASYLCRISGWLDVTVWMLGRGLTGRQSQQSNKCPLTRRDPTPQETSALRQQSWRNVRLKWARCSESLPNSTRKWAHWSPRGNTREAQSRFKWTHIFMLLLLKKSPIFCYYYFLLLSEVADLRSPGSPKPLVPDLLSHRVARSIPEINASSAITSKPPLSSRGWVKRTLESYFQYWKTLVWY